MARIDLNSIQKIAKERNSVHSKVAATYTVFDANGEKFVQIDTYGNADREIKGKISQSFQIDKATARYIIELLTEEFGEDFLEDLNH